MLARPRARIIGTGGYAPERVVTNFDLEQQIDTSDAWIVERTGIKQRHLARPDETTSDMATEACRRALDMAGLRPEDIGEPGQRHGALVQTGACRVDVVEPAGADTYVVTRLGGAGVTARLSAETGARPGAALTFAFDLGKASYFNPESGARIG